MKVKVTLVLLAITCAAVVVASCVALSRRMAAPAASAVDRIILQPHGGGEELQHIIESREAIGQMIAFLQSHEDGWREPWDTFPTPQVTILLQKAGQNVLVIWLGPNWIGRRDADGRNRLRSLSPNERDAILQMLAEPIAGLTLSGIGTKRDPL